MGSQSVFCKLLPCGILTANSTTAPLPTFVFTFFSYCSLVNRSSMIFCNWYSPKTPLDFTLLITFFKSPTLTAKVCISPNPLCTASNLSLTCLKDSPRRFSKVSLSFSSTVFRISSNFFSLPSCMVLTDFSNDNLNSAIFSLLALFCVCWLFSNSINCSLNLSL